MNKPPYITSYNDWGFDNFRFIVRELFLYFIAIFLKHDRLEQAAHFLIKNITLREILTTEEIRW